jgi:hypothetical protein
MRICLLALLTGCAARALPIASEEPRDLGSSPDLSAPEAHAPNDLCGAADLAPDDFARTSDRDLSAPRDLAASHDLSRPHDLSEPHDLSRPRDLAEPRDLSRPRDLAEPRDLSTPRDLASPPDLSTCTNIYGNWTVYTNSIASTSYCVLNSIQCGWSAFPPCGISSLGSASEPAAGQIDWSWLSVGMVGDWIGWIDATGHFYAVNDGFPNSTFIGDIDGSCHMTGTVDWEPGLGCIAVEQVSGDLR